METLEVHVVPNEDLTEEKCFLCTKIFPENGKSSFCIVGKGEDIENRIYAHSLCFVQLAMVLTKMQSTLEDKQPYLPFVGGKAN